MLLDEARRGGPITLSASMDSLRDYISVDDVADLLVKIALDGRHRVYNIASGTQLRNAELVEAVCTMSGCRTSILPSAPLHFPPIDTGRIRAEFDFVPSDILQDLSGLLGEVRRG
jgi:nucleoside-diphosphate-sugar epimerase